MPLESLDWNHFGHKIWKTINKCHFPPKPGAESQGHPVQTCWVWHILRKWCVDCSDYRIWIRSEEPIVPPDDQVSSPFDVQAPPGQEGQVQWTWFHHLRSSVFRNLACHHVICTAPLQAKSNGSAMVQQHWTIVCLQPLTGAHNCSTWVLIFCVSGMPWVVRTGDLVLYES